MEHWRRNRPLLPAGVTHILLWKIFPEIFLLPWRRTAAPRSWEAYDGSDEECDEDGDGHDDEVEVDDDEFPGKAEAGAPVTLWGFGAASETTIRLRERKMHQRDCFLFQSCQLCLSICPPVMSRLFQSCLNKLILFLCWARNKYDGWYIDIYIRSEFRILTHPLHLPDGDPISQTERRPLEMVAKIQRCSPLILDNESQTCALTNQSPVLRSCDLCGPMRAWEYW